MEVLGLNISDDNKVLGTDAKIKLDKVEYTSETNSFTVNGLTVNALAKTDGEVTITTSADVQGLYDKIKEFLEEYNKVINDLASRYNADTAKDMEPLTDEEKEAMGEATANKYEDKIKASLMRRDGKVDGVISAMTRAMASSYEVNGKMINLSHFGINTLGVLKSEKNEQYAYHIDGDQDDDTVSGNSDKLMKALTNDPDSIVDFFKKLTSNLYKELDDKMKKTSLSSAYTMYDDVSLKKENDYLADLIKQWERKVEDEEDRYYKKFAAMESALTKLNGQQSSLSGLFSK
jgi:flagellar hook-associated protein 2